MQAIRKKDAAVIAVCFGGFQAAMPLIGWRAGLAFEQAISSWDHWIVAGVLTVIGARMIKEAFNPPSLETRCEASLRISDVLFLAVATSIDALATGFAFALVPETPIAQAAAWIGGITFSLSYAGVIAGSRLNNRFRKSAEFAGGAVLIAIGAKALLEHLQFFG